MSRNLKILLLLLGMYSFHFSTAQKEDLTQVWPAKWIVAGDGPWSAYGVHRFRRTFELDTVPSQLIVHTSGDNRYQLYVNGQRVTWGPLRGDLDHWYYESTDISAYLQPGRNVIAAQVLNYGAHRPDAQLSVQTGFLLAAGDRNFRFLNTNTKWKATYDKAYSPNIIDNTQVRGYYGGGSREIVDGRKYQWDWEALNYDDQSWPVATVVESAFAKTCRWASRWKLTPRTLPHEKVTPQRFASIRMAEGVKPASDFVEGEHPFSVPAHTSARLIFDQGVMTTAYPVLKLSGGKDAQITIRYVEAPIIGDPKSRKKGHRAEIEGKHFFGYFDRYIADGGSNRSYRPFWWRAFRYVEMTIETQAQDLQILDFYSDFSTYPFATKAQLRLAGLAPHQADTLQQILAIGERTIRLNAHETFMDCPYYEESQFEGDTRVQALVSYGLFGDGALGKNAIEQFSWSINGEGFLSARYPTNSSYYIPNYNIYWIGMLHDYMMYFGEPDYLRSKLPIVRQLLHYFLERARPDGTVQRPDYHNFVDWAFPRGEGPFDEAGYSALVDLHVLLGLQWATALEAYAGAPYYEQLYRQKAEQLRATIPQLYWKPEKGLFADTPSSDHYSVHTNHLAILTGLVQGETAAALMAKTLTPTEGMIGPTIYWQFYQFEALHRAGMGNQYLQHLGLWKKMIRAGVTTWPETGLESRSECHAWGASPNYHLYKLTAGIEPAEPAFAVVKIKPGIKEGEQLQLGYPHPKGLIKLELEVQKGRLRGKVWLPKDLTAELHWQEQVLKLKGEQEVDIQEYE